jgi:hypothetical protein
MASSSTPLGRAASAAAVASVARETASAIQTPRYTESALAQMGWERSYGQPTYYRWAYQAAFVLAWQEREYALDLAACPSCHGERVLGAADPIPCPVCA